MKRLSLEPITQEVQDSVLNELCLPEHLWESAYQGVTQQCAEESPLHAFWKHYYGASAEMEVNGQDLLKLYEDCQRLCAMQRPDSSLAIFLRGLGLRCLLAYRVRGSLRVIAD
jgi:hypothetical protein